MPVQALNCPNCGAPLPDAEGRHIVLCRHCGSSVRLLEPPPAAPEPPLPDRPPIPAANYRLERSELASVALGPDDVKHVIQLLRDRQRITAIQYYHDKAGGSLGEAKEAIDAIEAGLRDAAAPLSKPSASAGRAPDLAAVHDLVRSGDRMEAIRVYRELTNASPREAVTAIEGIERQISRGRPARRALGTGRGCLGIAGLMVAFVLVVSGGCGLYLQTKPIYRCSIEAVKAAAVSQRLLQPPVNAGYLVLTPGFEESSGFSSWELDAEYFAPVWGGGKVGLAIVQVSANSTGYSAMSARMYLDGETHLLRPWGRISCP